MIGQIGLGESGGGASRLRLHSAPYLNQQV